MSQVIRPRIPYQGPIYEGIHEGKQIKITGNVPYGAERFTVNLMNALNSECNRPLHVSVRFSLNTVVRNIYKSGTWGTEERNGPFPFATGRGFTMVITVERSAYQISVNGQHCWDFVHRLPFSRVRSLLIDGDVSIDRIEFINHMPPQVISPPPTPVSIYGSSSIYPQVVSPPSAPVSIYGGSSESPLSCVFPIHGGIRPGMSIYITGRPTGNPYSFTFNIQKGSSVSPPPDVAFHFDVRFYNYSIVRNSRLNGVWYSEESMMSHFPFLPGCNFDVIIKVQSDTYVVMVNGQHFVSFRHRLNVFPHFNVLSIEKDVIVTSIRYD